MGSLSLVPPMRDHCMELSLAPFYYRTSAQLDCSYSSYRGLDTMGTNDQTPDLCQPYRSPSGSSLTPAPRADQNQQDGKIRADQETEICDIEDLPPGIPGPSPGSEVVKPYAIEEPDEESTSEPEMSDTAQQRQRKYWEDLISSMEGLYCDSDHSNPASIHRKRGRKRKPTTTDFVRTGHSGESALVPDTQYASPSLSSKRPKKKDKQPREKHLRSAQEVVIQQPRGLSSSSDTSVSTDTSDANLSNGIPTTDAMDLD
ncbi:hypothetical protein BDW75DRAFT_197042 [Aspergillus navahoensis]